MRKISFLILLLSALTILLNPVYVYSTDSSEERREFAPENISSFIRHLIHDGEYYRAHTELSRLASYYPDFLSSSCYSITESYIYYKSGRYDDILKKVYIPTAEDPLCALNIFRLDSMLKSGDLDERGKFEELLNYQCFPAAYSDYYRKRRLYYSIMGGFNDGSFSDTADFAEYSDSMEYARGLSGEKKSPLLGALAGIIPGMGYVYAGETGTGITALIVITAGSAIAWGAHANSLEPLAAVSGAATFFMYAGSIAGGYMQTVKFNRGLSERLVLRLDRDFMLDRDIDDIYIKCGIESNVR